MPLYNPVLQEKDIFVVGRQRNGVVWAGERAFGIARTCGGSAVSPAGVGIVPLEGFSEKFQNGIELVLADFVVAGKILEEGFDLQEPLAGDFFEGGVLE